MSNPTSHRDVPAWLWLGLPLVRLAASLLAPLAGVDFVEHVMKSELGIWENLTILLVLLGGGVAVAALLRRPQLPRSVRLMLVLLVLGSIFYAGEEASWGQHWRRALTGYRPSGGWVEGNRQRETNLHNQEGPWRYIFTVWPRRSMSVLALGFGVAAPLAMIDWRRRGDRSRSFWHWMIPTPPIIPAMLLLATASWPKWIMDKTWTATDAPDWDSQHWWIEGALFEPTEEFREVMFALGVLIFAWSIYRRSRPEQTVRPETIRPGTGNG